MILDELPWFGVYSNRVDGEGMNKMGEKRRVANLSNALALVLVASPLLIGAISWSCASVNSPAASTPAEDTAAAARKAEQDAPCGAPLTPPTRAFLKSDGRAVKHDGSKRSVEQEAFEPLPTAGGLVDRTTWLPANTSVDVLRRLELLGTGVEGIMCGLIAVRVVDAGGAVEPGTVFALPAGLVVDQASGPSPAEAVQRKIAEIKSAKDARIARVREASDREVTTGRCSDEHIERLRRGLQILDSIIRNERWILAAQKFIVATKDGASLSFAAATSGEHHIFAVGFGKPDLSVIDAQGYGVRSSSIFDPMVETSFNLPTRSAVVTATTGDEMKLNVKGHGCALVIALHRF